MQISFNFYTLRVVNHIMEQPNSDIYMPKEPMTIVVPVYNRALLIGRCLDSLYAQTYRPLRVIVVDNGSTDDTEAMVCDWTESHSGPDFSVTLLHESARGAAFARQTGLEHVDTDKVMFFDSDDAMRPECVSEAMAAWQENPDAEMVAWPTSYHCGDASTVTHAISGRLIEKHLVHSILRTLGYAVKTDTIRNAGGWKGEFKTWDDFELGVRLLLPNPRVIGLKRPMADVYAQEESISGTDFASKAGSWEKSLDAIENYIRDSSRHDSRRLLNIVNYRRAILAAEYAKERRPDLAKPLMLEAMKKTPAFKKPAIWFAYNYTRMGLRGAFLLVGPIL